MMRGFYFEGVSVAEELEVAFGGAISVVDSEALINMDSRLISIIGMSDDAICCLSRDEAEDMLCVCEDYFFSHTPSDEWWELVCKVSSKLDDFLYYYDADSYYYDDAESELELLAYRNKLFERAENGTLTCSDLDFYSDWSKDVYGFRDRSLHYLYAQAINDNENVV